jgi:hypothetical protein
MGGVHRTPEKKNALKADSVTDDTSQWQIMKQLSKYQNKWYYTLRIKHTPILGGIYMLLAGYTRQLQTPLSSVRPWGGIRMELRSTKGVKPFGPRKDTY